MATKTRSLYAKINGKETIEMVDDENGFIKENQFIFHGTKILMNGFYCF
jgi:hypothetical protein